MQTSRTYRPRALGRIGAGLVALAFGLVLASAARADGGDRVQIEATGEASEDEASARTRAIDDAFARALEQLIADQVSRADRRRYAKPIRERIVRRARLYVVSFSVDEEASAEGHVRVRVVAQIDRARVVAALEEIGVRDRVAGPASRERRPVVLLLHANLADKSETTFGQGGGDGGIAGRQFARALRDQGFRLVDVAGTSAPVSGDADSGLPVDDKGAAAVVQRLGAGGAFVVGISLVGQGPVRGTRLSGAEVAARVRVLTEAGRPLAKAEVRGAGFGEATGDAVAAAVGDAIERALGAVLAAASRHWPAGRAPDDGTVVEIRDVGAWAAVEAVLAQLRAARGISSVAIRRVRSGEVVLAVDTTLQTRELVAVVGAVRFEGGSIAATSRGQGIVEAHVQTADGESTR